MMDPPEEWLTIADAAQQLGVQPGTLRAAIQRGVLAVRKEHNRLLVST